MASEILTHGATSTFFVCELVTCIDRKSFHTIKRWSPNVVNRQAWAMRENFGEFGNLEDTRQGRPHGCGSTLVRLS